MRPKTTAIVFTLLVLLPGIHDRAAAASLDPALLDTARLRRIESSPATRRETFNIVWRTVKEKYFDHTFGGINWDHVRARYAPRVERVRTDRQLYELLQQMLSELGQSHFSITPPEAVVGDEAKEPSTGGIGIDIRLINGDAVVTRVEPDSPAAKEGIRTGFVLIEVDETPIQEIVARFAESKDSPGVRLIMATRAIMSRMQGNPGSSVRLRLLNSRDNAIEVKVLRQRLKGALSPRIGTFPPQYVEFESRRLTKQVGYVRFNKFVTPLMSDITGAIRSMGNAKGIIIDLRGNPGGLGAMSSGIAGLLEKRQISLGTMRMRDGPQNFVVQPKEGAYSGTVVVLVDSLSASTSEVFAAGMQENGRAVVIGERSAGAALPSLLMRLPTGALFQYAIADFRTPKGQMIEGRGVTPDIEVRLDRAALLTGRDAQLDAAIMYIQRAQYPFRKNRVHSARRYAPAILVIETSSIGQKQRFRNQNNL